MYGDDSQGGTSVFKLHKNAPAPFFESPVVARAGVSPPYHTHSDRHPSAGPTCTRSSQKAASSSNFSDLRWQEAEGGSAGDLAEQCSSDHASHSSGGNLLLTGPLQLLASTPQPFPELADTDPCGACPGPAAVGASTGSTLTACIYAGMPLANAPAAEASPWRQICKMSQEVNIDHHSPAQCHAERFQQVRSQSAACCEVEGSEGDVGSPIACFKEPINQTECQQTINAPKAPAGLPDTGQHIEGGPDRESIEQQSKTDSDQARLEKQSESNSSSAKPEKHSEAGTSQADHFNSPHLKGEYLRACTCETCLVSCGNLIHPGTAGCPVRTQQRILST